MTDQTTEEPIEKTPKEESTEEASRKAEATTTKSPSGMVSEASYVGLQKVVSKKDAEIEKLNTRIADMATQFEELKSNTTGIESKSEELQKQLADAQQNLATIEEERNTLDKQLSQQKIVMKEFPQLAGLANFIPQANDDEQFRANAKEFLDALGTLVDGEVTKVLKGSTASASVTEVEDMVDETELERAWSEVYSLAGKPGEEKNYETAFSHLQDLIAANQQQ